MDSVNIEKVVGLKPALISINDLCKYLGGMSRAKIYTDIIPHLEMIKIGGRNLATVESADAFIASQVPMTKSPNHHQPNHAA